LENPPAPDEAGFPARPRPSIFWWDIFQTNSLLIKKRRRLNVMFTFKQASAPPQFLHMYINRLRGILVPFVFTCFLLVFTGIVYAQAPAGKTININIFGGTSPYNNTAWNNWNEPANKTSPVLRFADGVSSGVTITTSVVFGVSDNGTNYPTTMCPPEVGRFAMLSSTTAHTLTFANLKRDGSIYDLEIYASRNNTGHTTRFTVNGQIVNINTASNYTNVARFVNLLPNASGQIVITISRPSGTYAYVNGLKLVEKSNVVNINPVANAGSNQSITLPTNSVVLTGSGSDADGSITGYQWTKITGPTQFNIVSGTAAQTTVGNLVQGVYSFELRVTDNGTAIARDTVQVTVNPAPIPNQAPVVNAGPNQTITLPSSTVTLNGSGTDNDGTIASRIWTKISGPESYVIASPTTAQTTITGLIQGTYTFELAITDDDGATGKDTVTVTVNPEPPNQAPVANAGTNQTITLPLSAVTLNGSAVDNDGTIASIAWTKIAGSEQYIITSATSSQTTVTGLTVGTYSFELTVTDDDGAVGRDTVTVTVNPEPPNQAPSVNAGSNQTISLPVNAVTLNGIGTDNDGTVESVTWTKLTGPEQYTITSATSFQTTVTGLIEATYSFELAVTDDDGAVGRDTVTVTVNPEPPNQAPSANAGTNQTITLPVNTVTLNGSGTDSDGTIVSFTWTKVTGPEQYTITSATSSQTTITGLTEGTYTFELTVTDDDEAIGKDIVTITVNPEPPNQAPSANAGSNQAITLPVSTVTLNGSGTDNDGTIVSFTWTKIAGPEQYSITSGETSQTTVTGLTTGVYSFELVVADNDGATGKDTVIVTVNPAPPTNQLPVANAGADQAIATPSNSITLAGSGTDADGTIASYQWTKISGPTQFTISSPNSAQTNVTNLAQGVYGFALRVTDNQGAIGRDTVLVAVSVYVIPVTDAGAAQTITSPASAANVSATFAFQGATLKNLRWSKAKVPGQSPKKVVWIGSSTLSGTGASVSDSAVVWRVGRYYTGLGIMSSWLNLGVSGANVFQGMPTGYVPKGAQLSPDVTHNVTYALSQGADVVVVGYPSNGYEGTLSITEIMFAYRTIYNTVVNAGKKCYIMTAQPRPAFGTVGRNLLKQIADSIIAEYPDNYIQGYYNLVQTGTHNLLYNSGDNIHLNNAGHRVLFNSVVARNIFETWTNSPSIIAAPTSASTSLTNLAVGKHVFQVSVTDTHEQSANDTVTITVNPEPVVTANAGPDQQISLPVSSISLNGSGSMLASSYLWRQLTGPSATTIANASAATTNVSGLLTAGTYSFELALNGGVSKDTVYVFATIGSTDKVININIFGGSNPYNNTQWNNWNEPANRTSPVLKYADGVSSGVTITTSATFSVSDNGTSYPTTMCPREVGRYAMISSTGAHTLTFSNLKTDGTLYNLEIYASRNNTGNTTRFTVNGKVVDINTSNNYTNAARFTNLIPNASGQIVITITRAAGTYAYVNGLKLTEVVNLIVSN
jgi:hypothetical protein